MDHEMYFLLYTPLPNQGLVESQRSAIIARRGPIQGADILATLHSGLTSFRFADEERT